MPPLPRDECPVCRTSVALRTNGTIREHGALYGPTRVCPGSGLPPWPKVYLAARYTRRLELCGYRDELTGRGYRVTSRWLNGSHQIDNEGRPLGDAGELLVESGAPEVDHYRHKFATDDLEDVLAAHMLIAFTEQPRTSNSRGGRHVELGIALGAGKRVIVAGPRENVFCWLPQVEWYPDWPALLLAWTGEAAR